MIKYEEINGGRSDTMGKSVKKLSKSDQKFEKLSKCLKSLKGLKNLQKPLFWRNIYQSTDPLSVYRYKELELTSEF